ncbi:hypothetical protein BVX98_05555 [bacterium F11]|nr:hypothetical protein BVX98_05555 [bacterium F11]
MEFQIDWAKLVLNPLKEMLMGVVAFTPNLISSLFTIILGVALAYLAKIVIQTFLRSIGFDGFATKIHLFSDETGKDDQKIPPHKFGGVIVYWTIIFSVVIMALSKLRLKAISFQLNTLFTYAITVIIISAIVVAGLFLSMLICRIIKAAALSAGYSKPDTIANISKWIVLFFTFSICLYHIGIQREIFLIVLGVTYLTLCITFVIAFGIGGSGFAATILNKLVEKK